MSEELVLPPGKSTCEGFLTKQSQWLKQWRRRYFYLFGNQLYFCAKKGDKPHGVVDLSLCLTVKSADLKTSKRHSFEVSTPTDTYLLFADDEAGKDEWIGAIGKAIVQNSTRSYIRDAEEEDDDD